MKKTNKLSGEDRRRQGLRWIALFIALFFFVFTACDEDKGEDEDENEVETGKDIAVSFNSVSADGFEFSTTTKLTLTFSQAITGLSASDISLSGVAGVTEGTLSNSGSTYTLPVSGFTSGGDLAVSVAKKEGYNIGGSSKSVKIFYYANSQAGKSILALPPIKAQFEDNFLIGNIFNPGDAASTGINNAALKRHFNVLTPENAMKPDKLISAATSSSVTWNNSNKTTAKRMVDAATADGFKVVGHTLLWHNQNYSWITNLPAGNDQTTKDANLAIMKKYISEVLGDTDFKGKIYAWDVLNEVFPDGNYTSDWKTSMRSNNPWFKAIGSDFVYEAYLAAREADPDAILLYNDYNLDNSGKATMVRNMVKAVNDKYSQGSDRPAGEAATRLLIEGIGMQSHHNTNVSANSIKATLELFKPLGVEIHISELDVLAQGYSSALEGAGKPPASGNNLTRQAQLYHDYMKLFVENAATYNIKRVSLWGITDNQSWRAAGQPLLFDANGKAKASYDAFVALGKTVENPEPDVESISLVPTRFGDANSQTRSVTINGETVTIMVSEQDTGEQRGWIGFYYTLPLDWSEYTTIEVTWTATVTSTVAKLAVKKGVAQDSALVGSAETGDKYKDITTTVAGTFTDTWSWSTSFFTGMNSPGITFQINNYDPTTDIPQNWTFEATKIELKK